METDLVECGDKLGWAWRQIWSSVEPNLAEHEDKLGWVWGQVCLSVETNLAEHGDKLGWVWRQTSNNITKRAEEKDLHLLTFKRIKQSACGEGISPCAEQNTRSNQKHRTATKPANFQGQSLCIALVHTPVINTSDFFATYNAKNTCLNKNTQSITKLNEQLCVWLS